MDMQRLINAVLFQLVMFVCLLAGNVWASCATARIYCCIDSLLYATSLGSGVYSGVFLALGIMIDGACFSLVLFFFAPMYQSE